MRIFLLLPVIAVTSFFTLLLIYTKLFGPIPFSVNSITTTKSDTFQVSGEGKVTYIPDVAMVTVGVLANGQTVKATQDQLNSSINKVSAAIKNLGVDSKDIQTQNYSINPNYDFTGTNQRITGYSANSNLYIKVREIDKANGVIDAATQAGANQVGSISFDIDEKTRLQNEAREKAVEDAKSKAENAAKIAGFRLGRIVNYSENFGGVVPPMPIRTLTLEKADTAVLTQVEPGSSEVIVNVTLSYEIQ